MSPDLLGWIASAVFLIRLLPQPARLARTGVPDGLSPLAALNAVIADVGWVAYGLSAHLAPVWSVAAVALVIGVITVVLLAKRTTSRDLLGSGVWAAIVVATASLGALGAVLAASVAVINGPQVWVAIEGRNLTGISPSTWLIAILDASLWGAYGIATRDGALIAYGVVMIASAVVILARIRATRRAVTSLEISLSPESG